MALVNTKEMFKKAYDGGYAIGAFNINDMEIIQGIMSACAELKAPVILQVSSSARKYAHPAYLVKMVEAAVKENPDIPVACIWTMARPLRCARLASTTASPPSCLTVPQSPMRRMWKRPAEWSSMHTSTTSR